MLIDYKNVTIFQDDTCVLKGANLHVDEGEFIYLIGKVGSGKSSLLKTMYCELDIEEADAAIVLDRNLTTLKRKHIPQLRREMGIIFQEFKFLHDRSIYKNLRFVLKATGWKNEEKINERIKEVLEDVGMSGCEEKMPHELSGGEQQRVTIARALLNKPKIIIADEPTGNLDPETADNIVELLKSITRTGTAVVMSTHNIPMLSRFPGIVYKCEDGQLTEVKEQL